MTAGTTCWEPSKALSNESAGESRAKAGAPACESSETCVIGIILSILSYFELDDSRLDALAGHLLDKQMPDGGWNCQRGYGDTHSSVHTTILVLEGLHFYELLRRQDAAAVRAAKLRGREFLLAHRLFRSHRTGEIIRPIFFRSAFPSRWHYDILRAPDYFRAVDAPRDRRLAEALQILLDKQGEDGRWARSCSSWSGAAPPAAGTRFVPCAYCSGGLRASWQSLGSAAAPDRGGRIRRLGVALYGRCISR